MAGPYFASVFFSPAALVLGLLAFNKKQKAAGILAVVFGAIGLVGIMQTSSRISGAQEEMRSAMEKAQQDIDKAK
ncbi:hypothetical protein [Glaciimonas sp. PAMC28666]|uniref:hypothetical protein n=1 Tax=Glaciimonas sp. PAMC28666 TaxID=2807626 RepID=UPI00196312C3|nr:hypothetical protein [Glaciimonas sp. PAMC28666]QRX83254.1 hypothetical protein JQN73_02965 [Glaciimonas sp. PAMC28666]